MTRSSFRSLLLSVIAVVAIAIIAAAPARAQQWNNPNCCHYTVDIAGIVACCFPVNVTTEWGGGFRITTGFNANGIFVVPFPPPPMFPACPPAPPFNWASLDGGVTHIVGPNQSRSYIDARGCCYVMSVGLDAGGCVYIKVRPCPPPPPVG